MTMKETLHLKKLPPNVNILNNYDVWKSPNGHAYYEEIEEPMTGTNGDWSSTAEKCCENVKYEMQNKIEQLQKELQEAKAQITGYQTSLASMSEEIEQLRKDLEFERHAHVSTIVDMSMVQKQLREAKESMEEYQKNACDRDLEIEQLKGEADRVYEVMRRNCAQCSKNICENNRAFCPLFAAKKEPKKCPTCGKEIEKVKDVN